ncbi:hypothetical protein EDC56_0259 [Sinobacterium caligoides]|uniref:Uncharacterized protein n=1 Tax=Sinobacterium caligoides TaxID=933926 RepID=A0A3N2DY01_9GAMM|nr:hypothetical protein EDC56_0259 [Sinobacterium caligoides]
MLHPRSLATVLWITLLFALPWPIYNSPSLTIQPLIFTFSHYDAKFSTFAVIAQAAISCVILLMASIMIVKQLGRLTPPMPISFVGLIIISLLFFSRTFALYSLGHDQRYNLQEIYQVTATMEKRQPATPLSHP